MATVTWHNGMQRPVITPGLRYLPKKPVRWWGSAVVYLADGSRIESDWRSHGPMTTEQARIAMQEVVKQMISEIQARTQ